MIADRRKWGRTWASHDISMFSLKQNCIAGVRLLLYMWHACHPVRLMKELNSPAALSLNCIHTQTHHDKKVFFLLIRASLSSGSVATGQMS